MGTNHRTTEQANEMIANFLKDNDLRHANLELFLATKGVCVSADEYRHLVWSDEPVDD